jgi:hypothetical protein
MGSRIFGLTDQRKTHDLNPHGEFRSGIDLIKVFDPEIQEFLSSYLLLGKRRQWLEETCHVKIEQNGTRKQIYLSASPEKRSKIDLSTFPFIYREDLNKNWRSVLKNRKSKKRSNEEITSHMTPSKKPCDAKSLAPIFKSLLQRSMGTTDPEAIGLMALSVANELATNLNGRKEDEGLPENVSSDGATTRK